MGWVDRVSAWQFEVRNHSQVRMCLLRVAMRERETELEMVRRHVEQGHKCIAKQRALIAHLKGDGLPSNDAEALLVTFEDIQRQHEDHLARINAQQG